MFYRKNTYSVPIEVSTYGRNILFNVIAQIFVYYFSAHKRDEGVAWVSLVFYWMTTALVLLSLHRMRVASVKGDCDDGEVEWSYGAACYALAVFLFCAFRAVSTDLNAACAHTSAVSHAQRVRDCRDIVVSSKWNLRYECLLNEYLGVHHVDDMAVPIDGTARDSPLATPVSLDGSISNTLRNAGDRLQKGLTNARTDFHRAGMVLNQLRSVRGAVAAAASVVQAVANENADDDEKPLHDGSRNTKPGADNSDLASDESDDTADATRARIDAAYSVGDVQVHRRRNDQLDVRASASRHREPTRKRCDIVLRQLSDEVADRQYLHRSSSTRRAKRNEKMSDSVGGDEYFPAHGDLDYDDAYDSGTSDDDQYYYDDGDAHEYRRTYSNGDLKSTPRHNVRYSRRNRNSSTSTTAHVVFFMSLCSAAASYVFIIRFGNSTPEGFGEC